MHVRLVWVDAEGDPEQKNRKQRKTEGNREEEEEVDYQILRGSLFEEEVRDGEAGMEKKMEG